jgi:hypothetical protein
MASFARGLTGGFETGLRFGQAMREREKFEREEQLRKDLAAAYGMNPEQQLAPVASPEQIQRAQAETQALQAQDAAMFGLTAQDPQDLRDMSRYAPQMPTEGQRVASPTYTLGGQTLYRQPTQYDIDAARSRAAADVYGRSGDTARREEILRGLRQEDRAMATEARAQTAEGRAQEDLRLRQLADTRAQEDLRLRQEAGARQGKVTEQQLAVGGLDLEERQRRADQVKKIEAGIAKIDETPNITDAERDKQTVALYRKIYGAERGMEILSKQTGLRSSLLQLAQTERTANQQAAFDKGLAEIANRPAAERDQATIELAYRTYGPEQAYKLTGLQQGITSRAYEIAQQKRTADKQADYDAGLKEVLNTDYDSDQARKDAFVRLTERVFGASEAQKLSSQYTADDVNKLTLRAKQMEQGFDDAFSKGSDAVLSYVDELNPGFTLRRDESNPYRIIKTDRSGNETVFINANSEETLMRQIAGRRSPADFVKLAAEQKEEQRYRDDADLRELKRLEIKSKILENNAQARRAGEKPREVPQATLSKLDDLSAKIAKADAEGKTVEANRLYAEWQRTYSSAMAGVGRIVSPSRPNANEMNDVEKANLRAYREWEADPRNRNKPQGEKDAEAARLGVTQFVNRPQQGPTSGLGANPYANAPAPAAGAPAAPAGAAPAAPTGLDRQGPTSPANQTIGYLTPQSVIEAAARAGNRAAIAELARRRAVAEEDVRLRAAEQFDPMSGLR